MTKQTLITQKPRGPAPTGKGELVGVRVQPDIAARIDKWASRCDDAPSRPEAIRRLVELGLKTKQ
jgi:hypothetical protein